MHIRDRIVELRRIKASELRPSPRNWRTHPPAQQDALRGLLAEIGYADALLVRLAEDGWLEIVDGHLRAETTPEQLVPVLVLDVNELEAAKLLATLDPLAGMAKPNPEQLGRLLDSVSTDNPAVAALLDGLAKFAQQIREVDNEPREIDVPESFQIIVTCQSEDSQRDLYERLTSEGFSCRVLTM